MLVLNRVIISVLFVLRRLGVALEYGRSIHILGRWFHFKAERVLFYKLRGQMTVLPRLRGAFARARLFLRCLSGSLMVLLLADFLCARAGVLQSRRRRQRLGGWDPND